MKPSAFHYEKPSSLDGLLDVMGKHGEAARILAGGQSLVPMMNFRLATPEVLIDINGLSELDYIRQDGDSLSIGALTRHNVIYDSPLVAELSPLMAEAYKHVAHTTIRNRGTIGGNLSHADPSSELPAVCICLEGHMILRSKQGTREVPAGEFFLGALETAIQPGEFLAEIKIPVRKPGVGSAFEEVSPRRGDFATTAVAATLQIDGGICQTARIAHAAVADRPARIESAEAVLEGSALDKARINQAAEIAASETEPSLINYHGDADYKRDLLRALTKRALQRASENSVN
ncbi:MAG: xanthine dehydrogenase family protein subunit M [Alphaproteobacteria bacterium]|jgi:carbon-monoxide dehydrogenase medium subunit|nr:xanthine dehydrogenase family protein subunit M [Alphaproteobacteria bacterium]MDP6590488.1 xanthine dehydrogenase family protein subunit M [Alphaproteobacteria bacterium]MDP6816935.1 xanthine dehydrogenase family protein subunit M [Alphaproteobacteria bacterium]